MHGYEVMVMETEDKLYSFYPEKIARIVVEHNLIMPNEEKDFTAFIRGY